jgi:hypothetical protein
MTRISISNAALEGIFSGWGCTGKHLLIASFSLFDISATLRQCAPSIPNGQFATNTAYFPINTQSAASGPAKDRHSRPAVRRVLPLSLTLTIALWRAARPLAF